MRNFREINLTIWHTVPLITRSCLITLNLKVTFWRYSEITWTTVNMVLVCLTKSFFLIFLLTGILVKPMPRKFHRLFTKSVGNSAKHCFLIYHNGSKNMVVSTSNVLILRRIHFNTHFIEVALVPLKLIFLLSSVLHLIFSFWGHLNISGMKDVSGSVNLN